MVVLSVAIGTKSGKLLLCRDFSEISRTLVEDCVNSLPQLIKDNQEHTFVEHNNLRLNYLPLSDLFLLSINDRGSNILEDLEVLRSVQSAMHNILGGNVSEDNICAKAIDIIFTLDDIISLGYRNISSESFLSNALEMDSANERLILMQREVQEKEAKKKAKEFLVEQRKKGLFSPKESSSNITSPITDTSSSKEPKFIIPEPEDERGPSKASTSEGKKTLKLGTQKKKDKIKETNEEASLAKDNHTGHKDVSNSKLVEEPSAFNPLDAAVKFNVIERIFCKLNSEGQMTHFEVKGEVTFSIQNPKIKRIAVMVESNKKNELGAKVPPNFNKKMWTEDSVLLPRDELTFQPRMVVPAIKYGFQKDKGAYSPINLSIWLSEKSLAVECEFNSDQKWLQSVSNLVIKIPNPGRATVTDKSNSTATTKDGTIEWSIARLGKGGHADASINVEFASQPSEDSIYPWLVDFAPPAPFGDFAVKGVKDLDQEDEDLKFEVHTEMKVEEFQVIN
jgi:hypothetical protein